MQWFHVRVICLVIALIKHIPTVDVWVKCVLENACFQLYFSGTLAQKAILYSENLFKTYSTFPYNFFWRKILIKPKLIALFHFILKFLFKFDSYGEMHFSFWSLLIFSSFSLCRKKREKIGKMRNTHTWKIQESTRAIFLMILILSKTKRNFFFLHLSSRRRNKYVKIFHFLRLLIYEKFFQGGEGRRKLGKKK